jgi:hypothetical protein
MNTDKRLRPEEQTGYSTVKGRVRLDSVSPHHHWESLECNSPLYVTFVYFKV